MNLEELKRLLAEAKISLPVKPPQEYYDRSIGKKKRCAVICTPNGEVSADPGDWIIRFADGVFDACKPSTFAATYEPVEEPPP